MLAAIAAAAGAWLYSSSQSRPQEQAEVQAGAVETGAPPKPVDLEEMRRAQAQIEMKLRQLQGRLGKAHTEVLILQASRALSRQDASRARAHLHDAAVALDGLPGMMQLQQAVDADLEALDRYIGGSPRNALPLIEALFAHAVTIPQPQSPTTPSFVSGVLKYLPDDLRQTVKIERISDQAAIEDRLLQLLIGVKSAALDNDRRKFLETINDIRRIAKHLDKDAEFLTDLERLAALEIEWQQPQLLSAQAMRNRMK